jgi:hypothetical protein
MADVQAYQFLYGGKLDNAIRAILQERKYMMTIGEAKAYFKDEVMMADRTGSKSVYIPEMYLPPNLESDASDSDSGSEYSFTSSSSGSSRDAKPSKGVRNFFRRK